MEKIRKLFIFFLTTKPHCLEARVGFELKCCKDTQNINLHEQSAKANKNSLVFESTKGVDIFILFIVFTAFLVGGIWFCYDEQFKHGYRLEIGEAKMELVICEMWCDR